MSGHQTSPEAQAWVDYWGKSKSMGHLAQAHHDFEAKNGHGAAPGGKPGGAAPGGGKMHVRVFADRTVTRRWMKLFDDFNRKKATAIELPGRGKIPREQFLNNYVYPVGGQVRHAIGVVWDLNTASLKEGGKLPKEGIDEVNREVQASSGDLERAKAQLDGGHYEDAYEAFIHGLNMAMQARGTIGQYDKKAIEDADHMVTALEITRDSGFALLAIAMPENAILIGVAGAAVKGADDWAGGEDLAKVTFEFVLAIFLNKLGEAAAGALLKAWGPAVEQWLDKAAGGLVQGGLSHSPLLRKIQDWVSAQAEVDMRKALLKLCAGEAMSPADAKLALYGLRKYVAEKQIAHKILHHLVDKLKETISAIGKVAYAEIVSGKPDMPVKERCLHLLEELKKEMHKETKAKSDLLWSSLSAVANSV